MFKLLKTQNISKNNTLRLGTYNHNQKTISTPCYFLISNFGGGGTNVSRLITYMDIFESGDSNLLLNYYYLNVDFKKTVGFDIKSLSELKKKHDIVTFFNETRKEFITKNKVISDYKLQDSSWNPLIILDSGSGNIFRDLIKEEKLTTVNFSKIYSLEIQKYIQFGEKHKIDILIGMDIAKKYTQKQGEHVDDIYNKSLEIFKCGHNNIELIKMTLENMTDDTKLMIFAPIHGKYPKEYESYLDNILKLEKKYNKRFDGFAIGGLGNLDGSTIYKICELIRNKLNNDSDDRPIHILGVGSLQNLIPMCLLGMDSFDCHSPWRRASEGKYVIPLINSKGKIIAKDSNFWKYVPISKFNPQHYTCDCEICKKFTLAKLKELYNNGGEYKYFAEILFFKHNISQQEFILKGIRAGNIKDIVLNIPESKYKKQLLNLISIN